MDRLFAAMLPQRRRLLVTVREVYLALAAFGGTGNGPPSWQTLWLGRRLRLLVKGVPLAAQLLDDYY